MSTGLGNVLVDADNPVDANRPEITPTAFDEMPTVCPVVSSISVPQQRKRMELTRPVKHGRFTRQGCPDGGNGTLVHHWQPP